MVEQRGTGENSDGDTEGQAIDDSVCILESTVQGLC